MIIDLEKTMEVDLTDFEMMCWLLGCYDIEEDEESEDKDND